MMDEYSLNLASQHVKLNTPPPFLGGGVDFEITFSVKKKYFFKIWGLKIVFLKFGPECMENGKFYFKSED